jgi:hypothetical protein
MLGKTPDLSSDPLRDAISCRFVAAGDVVLNCDQLLLGMGGEADLHSAS